MQFVVLFEDNPDKADQRTKHMAAHLAFLAKSRVQAAGPLTDPATGAGAGGMWLIEAANAAEAKQLVEADPFWPTGLRKSVKVLQWKQVFKDGKRVG